MHAIGEMGIGEMGIDEIGIGDIGGHHLYGVVMSASC